MPRQQDRPLRLFVAADLSEEVRAALAGLVRTLAEARLQGLRPVAAEGVHLTLKFLGAVPASRVGAVTDALRDIGEREAPVVAVLEGLGGFPTMDAPRVLWIGLGGDVDGLWRLHDAVQRRLEAAGFARDRRPFSPHLTLARLREGTSRADRRRAGELLLETGWRDGPALHVGAVSLVRSILRPDGARYQVLHRETLRGAVQSDSNTSVAR